jgi:putative ABC transport system permease protein
MLSLRTLLRHPIQFGIMILGISLGVAVMVAIDIANMTSARAFEWSTSAVTGRATHSIVAGDQGVDESLYVRLRTDPQWRQTLESAPLVIANTVSPQLGDVPFTLLGIDPLAEAPFRLFLNTGNGTDLQAITSLLTVPRSVLLSTSTAQQYGLQPCSPEDLGDSCHLALTVNGAAYDVYLTGLLEPSGDLSRYALDTLILTDISTAQSLTGAKDKLTQIDLIVPEEFDSALLANALPAGSLLVASQTRSSQVSEMTSAFQINLTALSLLASLVGVFLIYNAMTFSVLQRRSLFGTLRTLGYTREQVFSMVLGEAAIVGALGAGLGLGVGILLGQSAVQMVTQTINDLYFVLNVSGLQVPSSSLIKGALVGFLASVLAATPPAWEAAMVQPRLALSRSALETKIQSVTVRGAGLGVFIGIVGAVILAIPTRSLVISFAGTTVVVIGLALLTPLVTVTFMRLLGEPLGRLFGWPGRLASRNVIRSQSRTAVAVAALMIAVSVTIGVRVMIDSFRSTVSVWLEQTLRGDIYISAQGPSQTRLDTPLDPQALSMAAAHPETESTVRIRVVTVESEHGPVDILATSTERSFDPRIFLQSQDTPQHAWELFREGAVLLSEPLANRLGITAPGGSFKLLTPKGWHSFSIVGIYADYGSTRGTVRMSLDVYQQLWKDDRINGVALFLRPGASVDDITGDLRTRLIGFPDIQVNSNRVLRQSALDVFDRTFTITVAMQLITTVVAFIGVLSSLLALQLERTREIGILRALGMTPLELRQLALWETGLLGASAGLLALPTGYALAWILIFVINQRSFGWTLRMQADPLPFIQAFVLSVVAALLAAVYPIWRLNRIQAAEALRGE